MTANVFKEDLQMVVEAGLNGLIAMPVEYDVAIGVIEQALLREKFPEAKQNEAASFHLDPLPTS
jgi:hypothetical protein